MVMLNFQLNTFRLLLVFLNYCDTGSFFLDQIMRCGSFDFRKYFHVSKSFIGLGIVGLLLSIILTNKNSSRELQIFDTDVLALFINVLSYLSSFLLFLGLLSTIDPLLPLVPDSVRTPSFDAFSQEQNIMQRYQLSIPRHSDLAPYVSAKVPKLPHHLLKHQNI